MSTGELKTVAWLFLVYFVAYSFEINNFNISIDDEFLAYSPRSTFVEIGRWVHPLVRESLWPQPVSPAGPYIIFGICVCLGYLYSLRAFGVEKFEFFHFGSFAAFILLPVWSSQLEFSANIIPLGIAMVSASAAVLLTVSSIDGRRAKNAGRLIIAAVLLAVTAGAYQSAILVFPVLMIGVLLRQRLMPADRRAADFLVPLCISSGVLVVSIGIYLLVSTAVMRGYGIQPSAYGQHFVHPDVLFAHPRTVLRDVLHDLRGVYFSWWTAFGAARYVFSWTLIAGLAVSLYPARNSIAKATLAAASLLAMVALPAAFTILAGGGLPLRTLVATPSVFLMVMLLFHHSTQFRAIRQLAGAAVILVALQGLYIQSMYQARTNLVQKQDLLTAAALNSDILRVVETTGVEPIRVDFRGYRRSVSIYPLVPTTTSGASFFEWDDGNSYRMVRYMNLIGFHRYVSIDLEERERIRSNYRAMPSWPAPGSVKLLNDVVLVKLSD